MFAIYLKRFFFVELKFCFSYIGNGVYSQETQVPHHILLFFADLCMWEQFPQVFFRNAIFNHTIEGNNADFVVIGNALQRNIALVSIKYAKFRAFEVLTHRI